MNTELFEVSPNEEEEISAALKKRLRIGWFDQGRVVDRFVDILENSLPKGEDLPPYWQWRSLEHFTKKYTSPIMWAKTQGYHMLLINGHHVLRVWTDTGKTALVDINEALTVRLSSQLGERIFPIPEKSLKKCHPMTKRFRMETEDDVKNLAMAVRAVYGV